MPEWLPPALEKIFLNTSQILARTAIVHTLCMGRLGRGLIARNAARNSENVGSRSILRAICGRYYHPSPIFLTPFPDFSRSGKSAAEFAQEPSQFARMAPGPSRRRGRPAPPTPRIWLTAGALLAVACQGGGERPLETSAGLSLAPWGLAEPAAAAARASEPVIAQPAVGQIRTSGAVPRAPGG